jgi:hypothetical protein
VDTSGEEELSNKMSFLEKFMDMDRRWVYLLSWIFVLAPLLYPLGLPIPINQESKGWYNYIENIPAGSTVIFAPMYGTSGIPELFPMTVATMRHLWSRPIKLIVVTFWSEGALVFNILLGQVDPTSYGKVYGTDWIHLGYIPGSETAMASFGRDITGTVSADFLQGKATTSYPIMANIRTASDIDLIISIETGTPGYTEWLRQWQAPYGVPMIVGLIGVSVPGIAPYIQSGQVSAYLPGLTSSAEYENLIHRPGLAVAGVDAVSMSHLMVVALVVLGNVAYFASRGSKGGKK